MKLRRIYICAKRLLSSLIRKGNLNLVYQTRTGLSGLIVFIGTPLICFPMMYWKKALPYEVRKALHYLFYLFAIVSLF